MRHQRRWTLRGLGLAVEPAQEALTRQADVSQDHIMKDYNLGPFKNFDDYVCVENVVHTIVPILGFGTADGRHSLNAWAVK